MRAYLNGLRVSSPEIYSDLMDLSDAMKALGTDASLTAAEGLEILAGAMSSASGEATEGKTAFEQMGEDIARLAGEIDLQEALGAQDEYASGALDYLQEQMSEAIKAGENLEDKLGSVWANLSDAAKSTLVERLGDFTKGM